MTSALPDAGSRTQAPSPALGRARAATQSVLSRWAMRNKLLLIAGLARARP
jgi:hypothetical protein